MDKIGKSKSGCLFVVSAPTGGGKTTLVTNAIAALQNSFQIERVVTYTTRTPRFGEVNGIDYVFVGEEEFSRLHSANHFVEVTTYNDNLYGSPRAFLEKLPTGASFIAITDRAGIVAYKKLCDTAICVWITPPSLETLAVRLRNRDSETEESFKQRLELATEEMAAEKQTPLCSYLIINSDLETATAEFVDIIQSNLQPEESF
jgi:guanylate kinase